MSSELTTAWEAARDAEKAWLDVPETAPKDVRKAAYLESRDKVCVLFDLMVAAIDAGETVIVESGSGQTHEMRAIAMLSAGGMQYYSSDGTAQFCNQGANLWTAQNLYSQTEEP